MIFLFKIGTTTQYFSFQNKVQKTRPSCELSFSSWLIVGDDPCFWSNLNPDDCLKYLEGEVLT